MDALFIMMKMADGIIFMNTVVESDLCYDRMVESVV